MTQYACRNDTNEEESGPLDDRAFRTLAKDNPQQAFIVAMRDRPGVVESLQSLEYQHYPPDTDENIKFELFLSNWPDDAPMVWCVAAIPLGDLSKAEEVFKANNLCLRRDRIPVIISAGKDEAFPLGGGDNVFSVEGFKAGLAAVVVTSTPEPPKAKA